MGQTFTPHKNLRKVNDAREGYSSLSSYYRIVGTALRFILLRYLLTNSTAAVAVELSPLVYLFWVKISLVPQNTAQECLVDYLPIFLSLVFVYRLGIDSDALPTKQF